MDRHCAGASEARAGAPITTLEQWHALRALDEHGSVTAAAKALDKSQSTASYLIQQLRDALGAPVVAREGRRGSLERLASPIRATFPA